MQRLFIAIAIPATIARQLAKRQPKAAKNIKLIEAAQLHLTLHFVGDANLEAIDSLLSPIICRAFILQLSGPGCFGSLKRGMTLWWGVKAQMELLALKDAVTQSLLTLPELKNKIKTERNEFRPHITLARCASGVEQKTVAAFLRQPPLPKHKFPVTEFALYSSKTEPSGISYHLEKRYLLREPSKVVS